MSYFRRPMGDDGPITHPWQVDESIIATVPPTRVDCAQLPADSPWRGPGQVCAPTLIDSAIDMVKSAVAQPVAITNTVTGEETSGFQIPGALVIAGLAAGAYYLLRRKR